MTFVDGTDPQQFVDAVRPGRTQLVFVETPANPALSLTDIEAVAAIPGPFTVVDSTFATPVVQRPLDLGADLVLHAATKGLAGHNDALLGVVAGSRDLDRRRVGVARGPGRAGLAVRRLERAARHPHPGRAGAPAGGLGPRGWPSTSRRTRRWPSVSYPGLDSHPQRDLAKRQMTSGGTLVTSSWPAGSRPPAGSASRPRSPASHCRSAGPRRSSPTRPPSPASLTPAERAEMGITDGLVRISVGLEDLDDLIADLDRALDAAEG